MKCPYRIKTTVYKREIPKEALNKGDIVSSTAQDFMECDEEECPFYNSFEDTCARAVQEIGGGL